MSEDEKENMAVCRHFLFTIPPSRLEVASQALAKVISETPTQILQKHLENLKKSCPREYAGLHLNDQP